MNWLLKTSVAAAMLAFLTMTTLGAQSSYVNRGTVSYATRDSVTRIPSGLYPAREFPRPAIDPIYVNPGSVTFTNPPQIDATAFLNLGTFGVSTVLPYDFQNTLYYTNRGTMSGAPGFRFDYTDDFGIRRPAAAFVNDAPGTIQSLELNGYFGYSNLFFQTMTQIRATNVVSPGYLAVGNAGTIQIQGEKVNLTRGGLEVQSLQSSFLANTYVELTDSDPRPDAFYGDNAIYDLYWGAGEQQIPIPGPINTANILSFAGADLLANAPTHQVFSGPTWATGYAGFGTAVSGTYFTAFGNTGVVSSTFLTLTNFDGSTTNFLMPTNIFRQAVVVGLGDTNFTARARFGFGGPAQLGFGLVGVEIASVGTNVVQGRPETAALYFIDYLGFDTNTLIVTNLGPWTPTGRPYAYEVYRDLPGFTGVGANGNTPLFSGFLYERGFSNVFATNLYAGYAASIDNIAARPPLVPGVAATNTPGRVVIQADSLDLTKTRIRGMSLVEIKTAHLKTSEGAVVDVENLVYDMASTNGLLTMRNLAKDSVHAVRGELLAWTGIWSNQFEVVHSNWFIDPTTNYYNPVTNAIDINLYCLILSADLLTRTQQVVTHTLSLNSTNVVIDDPYLVTSRLEINAEGLTINGRLSLTNQLTDWHQGLTPNLRFLTNNGTIRPWNVGYYGADFPSDRRLERFINTGTLEAAAHEITSEHFEDSGTIRNDNDLRLSATTAILEGSLHDVGGAAHYYGQDYKLRDHRLIATRGLFFSVTNSLADAGSGSDNSFELQDGFHLLRKPRTGDLLGTAFVTQAARFASVSHTWAADDRGATAAGFADNVALGRLRLASQPDGELRFGPPVNFETGQPVPGSFAIYVDYLELSTNRIFGLPSVAEDPEAYLVLEPGLTIYFAMSNVNPEDLDGRFDGQLRWVRDYAGPSSGVDLALGDGRTLRVNLGLLQSRQIDSDGDGVVNALDVAPFDDLLITNVRIVTENPRVVELSWRAAARTAYEVSYTTNLVSPAWQAFSTATNGATSVQILTIQDTLPVSDGPTGGMERYYRVSYEP